MNEQQRQGAFDQAVLDYDRCKLALAEVNTATCLPHAGREACQLCVDDCAAAGYHAIEFVQVYTEIDANGNPVEGSGYVAPVVLADKCVGCGLCQARCYAINTVEKHLLTEPAIVIFAGPGKEDRLPPRGLGAKTN